jgi:hypothetical protein
MTVATNRIGATRFAVQPANLKVAGLIGALLLSAWLLLPLLTPVHPEGFTASVASLALHLNRDAMRNFDLLQPLNVEYFGLSKLGWLLGIAGLAKLGLTSKAAMTAISWAGIATLGSATVFLVRKWTGAPALLVAAGLIVLPGISESAFIFNDNVPSAAFAAAALAALYLPRLNIGAIVCGILLGLAALTRTDTILVATAAPLLLWERTRDLPRTGTALVLAAVAGASVWVGTLALFDASLLDVFKVANAAVAGWDRPGTALRPLIMLLYFLGLPGLLLVACGLYAVIRRKDWLELARLLAVPCAFALLIGTRLWEARQFLPLAPFFVALAIRGFQRLAGPSSRVSFALRSALAALLAVSLVGPAQVPVHEDGPHALGGRIANIKRWREWQDGVDRDLASLASLATQSSGARPLAVITDRWSEDRYAHLVFQEADYAVQQPLSLECAAIAERFRRREREIYLIRPQQGYVPYWRQLAGERMRRFGLPCIEEAQATAVFVASPARSQKLNAIPERTPSAEAAFVPLAIIRLSPATLLDLIRGYEQDAEEDRRSAGRVGSLAEASAATKRRTRFGS